jgi:hypothetical protein
MDNCHREPDEAEYALTNNSIGKNNAQVHHVAESIVERRLRGSRQRYRCCVCEVGTEFLDNPR